MRIVCHAQSLSGIGHTVRMRAIARGLHRAHEVYLVDGGRPVPVRPSADEPAPLVLPRLFRVDGRLRGAGGPADSTGVLRERAGILARAIERLRPDVLLIEHYPFSKWELAAEMTAAVAAARASRAGARVLCSVRDVVRMTRYEQEARGAYEARVLSSLRDGFDGILVHADPAFTRLEEHFAQAVELPIPVHYTGFVVEPIEPIAAPVAGPYAVLSCGGGTRGLRFLCDAIEAYRALHRRGAIGAMRLHVFPSPFPVAGEVDTLRAATSEGPFELRTFSPDFPSWLAGSALSIGRAGYNTCCQMLRAGVRSVLVPDPDMSDQEPRARRLAELGLATVVDGRSARVRDIAAAIETALARPPARPELDLDGIATTRQIVERLMRATTPAWPGASRAHFSGTTTPLRDCPPLSNPR